ncbi:MAG: hypothetical protein GC181_06330 [Bacteroidetes bacterium]|nr:hypothetical protein [Bacteroidota bacterium]
METLGIGTRIKHSEYGQGIICAIGIEFYSISFFEGGLREVERNSGDMEIIEKVETGMMVSLEEVEAVFDKLLHKYTDVTEPTPIADRWRGGLLVLEPKDENLQVKEIPIDTFFHKIVMVRDRLRVLEQNINSHKSLSDDEKVHMQQYVTRIYGSLTTFNVLFKHKEDQFVGEKGA